MELTIMQTCMAREGKRKKETEKAKTTNKKSIKKQKLK
jgi:hypothetical protein